MLEIGSRAQVFHGTAKQTSGGMKKKDIKKTDDGRYVSKKKSNNLNPALAARAEATKKIMDERKRMQGKFQAIKKGSALDKKIKKETKKLLKK